MAGIAVILRQADPDDKAEVYRQLDIKLTYKPGLRLIQAEASPSGSCTKVCPETNTSYKHTETGDHRVFDWCPRPDTRDIHTVIAARELMVSS
jgi:hypothetical protein